MGHLLGSSMVGLMATSSKEGLCHMLHDPGLLQPEPLSPRQGTADPCLHRRYSNTQRQVWFSLCGVSGSWCTQGFVWALWASLVGMGFGSKCYFALPTVLLGLLLCPWTWGIFFWWDPTFSCQRQVVILEFSQEKRSTHPSTLPSWDISWFQLVTHPAQHFSCTQHIG